jgi:tetratricopeptide (TPR) repeat protein
MKTCFIWIAVAALFVFSGIAVLAQVEGGGAKPSSSTTDAFKRKYRAPTKRTAPKRIAVKKTAAEYEAEGDRYFDQKDNESALVAYQTAAKLKPSFWSLYRNGWIYNDFGEFAKALASLDQAIALDSTQYAAYTEKGYAHRRLGQPDEAIAAFQRSISLKPDNYIAPYELGSLYREKQMYPEAERYLQQSLRDKPDNAKALNELGAVQRHRGRNNEAIATFNKAISIDAEDSEAYMGLGDTYFYGTSDYEKAIDAYVQGLQRDPDNEVAAYNIGYSYNDRGDFQNALTYLNKAIQLKPGYVEAKAELGFAQMKLKRYNEAAITLRSAVEASPNFDTSHYYLGQVFVHTGNRTGAMNQYRELQRLNSSYAEKLINMINSQM